MDHPPIDPHILAQQLRKPEGVLGEQVGQVLADRSQLTMTFVFEHLHVQPADHVLEIGFGPGEAIAEAVRLTPNGYVAGIDFSEMMLQMAEQRNHKAIMQEHVELTLGEASALPYEDDSFDKLFAMNVFHFWPEPLKELAECKRVLKPGGTICFYLTHHSAWLPGFHDSGVFIAHEPEGVEKILGDAGFRNAKSHVTEIEERKCFVTLATKND